MAKQKLVVVGNGMAGARTVEEILSRGGDSMFDIVMFGDEPYGNYNRIMLSGVLNGTQPEEEIFLNSLPWYRQNNIRLHAGIRATGILRRLKKVVGTGGLMESYDKCIIATGSRAYIPPVDGLKTVSGDLKAGIFVFRSLDDCRQISQYARRRKRGVVVGGGLLGLEAARGLQNFGLEVSVIHRGSFLMGQQLDADAGQILKSVMEDLGIRVLLNRDTKTVLGKESVSGVQFANGEVLETDLIVFATGIQPNAEIGTRCGLPVERAIVVDNHLRTIDPDVYAVGECAQHRGQVYGLVAPLWEQAKVLADHITGKNPKSAYLGSKLATKLKVMGVELASMGITTPADDRDEVVQFTEPRRGTYKKLIIRDGRLVGGILLGDIGKAAYLMQAFDRGTPLPEDRLALLFDIGAPPRKVTLDEMPADMQVCNCNGVSKGAILACVRSGKRSVRGVMDATRAGMGCGSCKGMVSDLVEWACGGETEEDPAAHYYVPGVPLSKPDLVEAIRQQGLRSVSAVFRALAGGKEDAGSKPGLASLLCTIWHDQYEDERDARFINDRVHANIQKDGTFSVIPQMMGGITSPAQLRRIAEVAEKYNVPVVKLTGGQRIDLLGVKKEDLPNVWRDLDMPSGFAYGKRFRTCKSCVGEEFCRFGLGDSMALAVRIEQRFQGIDSPGKMKLATAGCPRNCSEAMVKDIGAVAVEGGRWEIYVGGAAGASVRKGDILCVVDNEDDVIRFIGRFMQYYRENAKYLERTYGFVERVGIDKIRAVVVDDSEGIAARLDEEIQKTVDAYRDPWREAASPATANQFASLLPVLR